MDYSKFLNDDFDVKDWINSAFKANKDSSSTEEYSNMLARKLQMFAQEVNVVIEETSQKAVTSMPRVIRDIEYVRQEAALLHDQMKMVKQDIHKVEQDTSASMQSLLELDRVKTNLEHASGALEVADCWVTLSAEVKEALVSNDVDLISNKLVGMQESLGLLTSVPDYEEKKAELEELKNQFEQTASPLLVQCFMASSTEKAQSFVGVFTALGRLSDLYTYYERCHRGTIDQSWGSSVQGAGITSQTSLPSALAQLYDLLLSTWHAQMRWCSQVFVSPVEVVSSLLISSLQNLKPSVTQCMSEHLSTQTEKLKSLLELKQITDHFVKDLEAAVLECGKDVVLSPSIQKLVSQVFQPYVGYVEKYESLEAAYLTAQLKSIQLVNPDVMDGITCLSESVSKVFSLAGLVNTRCMKLTDGCGYPGLLNALKGFFTSYIKEFKLAMLSIYESSKAQALPSTEEDWTPFLQFLRIIQTCGELLIGYEELNTAMISHMVGSLGSSSAVTYNRMEPSLSAQNAETRAPDPFRDHSALLLNTEEARLSLSALRESVVALSEEERRDRSLMPAVHHELSCLSQEAHRMAFDAAFTYIATHLRNIWHLPVWVSTSAGGSLTANLPAFSLSPQEYITKVGQYLLTLPQHLEPFTPEDSPAVYVAMKYGNLPYVSSSVSFEHVSDLWLESVTGCTVHTYTEEILKITEISPHATRQLVTDIEYLCNVVDDLGFHATDNLTQVLAMLKAAPEDFSSASAGSPPKLVHTVQAMRKLV